VAELREEVTRVWAAAIMEETRAARAKRMAQERVVLLATTHGETDEAVQRVSALEGELVAARRARDATEEKFLRLSAKVATAERTVSGRGTMRAPGS
jgi:hypothetical protein